MEMEDPESDEWEIQEYASFKERDEPSTVKWILNKGCWIGKKMVITGVVITSAPIVLPPLVVCSVMGVVFSVPFGLVFASYACTNKLMSTLLHIPPSPLMLEYYGDDYDQEKGVGVACRFELDDGAGDYRQLDVNEKGYFTNEYEDYEIARENVIPEEEQEQIGDRYVQQEVEAFVTNVDEKGYYTGEEENVVDKEHTEDLSQGVDMVFELDDNMRQGEALVVDEDDKSYNSSEYEGNELGKENVLQEEEEERISHGYGNKVEALASHVDEDVKEEGYYTDEEEIETEGTDDKLRPEEVDNERMEDTNQLVDKVLELDDGGNDTREPREAVVVNVDENFAEKSCYINENEREMEDHVNQMENAIKDEESDKTENVKQGVEFRLGLDMAAEECKQMEEGAVSYIGGTDDDEGYEEESEQMEDIKRGVKMRRGLDLAADECKQPEVDTSTNIDGSVDDKSYEEESDQMEDMKQGVEMRLGLDVAPDECKPTVEETITNIGGSVDDKRYEEESEQMVDIKQGVEMRLGLDVAPEECNQTEEGTITSIDESVDDKGYEEDIGESLEGDVDSLEEEQKGNELLIESHLDESRSNAQAITLYDKEKGGSEKEGSGVVKPDYSINETASNAIFEEVTDDETADPVTVKEIDSQKLFEDQSKNEEPVGEMRHIVVLANGNEDNNFNTREVEEIDLVAREVRGDANKHERDMKSDEEVIRESMGTQEKLISDMSNGVIEDAILDTKKEHLTNLNADAREIGDESGLDLFDDNSTSIYIEILKAGDEAHKNTFSDDVDFMALPAFRRASLDTDNAKSASKVYTKMASREDILDDDKIWEKIGAMRAIVGYKAPSQPTCIGELKALYVFTGVEPPASYKGDSDLDEVNAKLKFLMSIIGVK